MSILGWFLRSRFAPLLTHASLLVVTASFYGLLLWLPFWIAFIPCVILAHRVGVLVHEYVHGIPFARYRHNHAVVTAWDGIMMTLGMFEIARGMHLTHHRWLNVPAPDAKPEPSSGATFARGWFGLAATFAAVRHLMSGGEQGTRKKPYVKKSRMLAGFVISLATMGVWIAIGRPDMIWRGLVVIVFTMIVPMSLRDTLEHNSDASDPGFANEYRTVVPMFNVNRHIHHHEDPSVPWYLLEWRTAEPLPRSSYLTYWYRRHIKHDFVRMKPMPPLQARSHRGIRRIGEHDPAVEA